ncbi:MAG: hypothetical protein HW402_650 [Dehalococcoidales bacterium]|nr:hypothetical protein [Dehalococcoidales bacterium]
MPPLFYLTPLSRWEEGQGDGHSDEACIQVVGEPCGTRTHDQQIKSLMLYQLS